MSQQPAPQRMQIPAQLVHDRNYVDGQWRAEQATFPVTNPATGAVITDVARAGAQTAQDAIAAAQRAFPGWRDLLAKERAARLRRWYELMVANADDLAVLLSAEQGKPLAEARGEVLYAAGFLEWFAEEAKRVYGDVIPTFKQGSRIVVLKQPIGVVAAITPWNFPLAMVTRKVGPALAAGCTMVLKPATETPLSSLALADLAAQAGIPAGVFNVVAGDTAAIGGALMASPVVRKITFTGSTEIGKMLVRQSADTLKKVSAELGGNAPFIVFDDADVDAAVAGAMASKFRNTGQTCVCVNRFYVQDGVYEQFTSKLTEAVSKLRVGDALAGPTDQGPLINAKAVAKVEEHIADALAHGAQVLCGGARHELGGTFFQPTVLSGASPDMMIATEETFGPVAAVFRFSDENTILAAVNDTPFGLSAYFYARDIGRVWRIAEGLEAGIVGINEGLISTEVAPFGGVKESGYGREGSKYGIEDYVVIKYLLMGGLG